MTWKSASSFESGDAELPSRLKSCASAALGGDATLRGAGTSTVVASKPDAEKGCAPADSMNGPFSGGLVVRGGATVVAGGDGCNGVGERDVDGAGERDVEGAGGRDVDGDGDGDVDNDGDGVCDVDGDGDGDAVGVGVGVGVNVGVGVGAGAGGCVPALRAASSFSRNSISNSSKPTISGTPMASLTMGGKPFRITASGLVFGVPPGTGAAGVALLSVGRLALPSGALKVGTRSE